MGYERIVRVQHLHHVAVHPVRVNGCVVGNHHLPILSQAGVAGGLDFGNHSIGRTASARREAGHFVGQRLQGEFCVADQGVMGRVDAVDVELIQVALDDGLVRGVGDAVGEPAGRQAGTDGKDDIALMQVFRRMFATHADEERVVLRKRALGLQCGDDRRVGQLRQRRQLGRRASVDDPLTGIDERILRAHDEIDSGGDVGWVRCGLPALGRRVRVDGFVVDAGGVGHCQHHRTRSAAAQHGEGAAHELGHAFGPVDIPEPLGNGLQAGGNVEQRILSAARRHSVGDAQHRRIILERLRQAGVGVLQTGAVHAALHGAHANAIAGGNPRVSVGQRHGVTVVAHHNHGHALASQGVIDATDGEGGNPLHTLLLQNAGDGSCNVYAHISQFLMGIGLVQM